MLDEIKKYDEEKHLLIKEFTENRKKTREELIKKLKKINESNINENISVCIDCNYQEYMDSKNLESLAKQLKICYSKNKDSTNPLRLQ
jgi:hypothetical protein